MAELPKVTAEYFQILVMRELRKAGFELGEPRIHRRSELPEAEHGFVLELVIPLGEKRALVVCRAQDRPVGTDVVESVHARLTEATAAVAIVFSTAEYTADAVAVANRRNVALLRVVDGRTVFDTQGADHYPSWLPSYLTQRANTVLDQLVMNRSTNA